MQRRKLADAIRALSMDAVQKANSGHPGAPMGMADIAEVLWNSFMKHNPQDPTWFDRDRFVLSNGHASMLLYSLLHLTGYALPMEALADFRQLGSLTPGHPERNSVTGVETTTGPLGQGLANAVGMAIAERRMAAEFNRPDLDIVDHYTYAFLGDGCLMEGISHEACSLAGTLQLGKLIAFYDDNGISIDGEVDGWFTDDTPARFRAYGWQVLDNIDGHDAEALFNAIAHARASADRPTLICCKTWIGYGSPNKAGTGAAHGAPLGDDEIAKTREQMGWEHEPFVIPADVAAEWDAREKGGQLQQAWDALFERYQTVHAEAAAEFTRRMQGELPANWDAESRAFIHKVHGEGSNIASRKASQNTLDGFGPLLPELVGGSADLKPSNLTFWSGSSDIAEDAAGNYIYFGVREFAMSAIANGMALHGGQKVYVATFLMFSEYARNALRVAALMKAPSIFVYTHDSIGVGEDGPTHQPVEQAATLRLIPNMSVWRPCDDVETAVAWKTAIERDDGPSSLLFSRQNLKHMERSESQLDDIARGGYILHGEEQENLQAIIIATGSEVDLAMQAASMLEQDGIKVRVVSMPCTDVFDAQPGSYREHVLPKSITKRVAVEAGVSDGWHKYLGFDGVTVCLDGFGESGPASQVFEHFGFTANNVAESVRKLL